MAITSWMAGASSALGMAMVVMMGCQKGATQDARSAGPAAGAGAGAGAGEESTSASAGQSSGPAAAIATSPGVGPAGAALPAGAACPLAVAGTEVAVNDTEDGVALTFTTQSGDQADLRQRVQHLGTMYQMHGAGRMMWRQMRRGPGAGMGPGAGRWMGRGMGGGPGTMPAVTSRVDEVSGGARLTLTPTDATQLGTLRQRVRLHVARMQSGQCWTGGSPRS